MGIKTRDNCIPTEASVPRRIGIMGGSFDPVHLGHINLAKDALVQADLDQILVIPAGKQPFKQDRKPASGHDRMEMLRIAFGDCPKINPCSYELDRDEVSYTYLTLRAMKEHFGDNGRIFFIVGTDSVLMLEKWMNSREILTEYSYVVGSRPGYRDDELALCMDHLREEYGTELVKIENSRYDISSTEIRELAAEGRSLSHLVGEDVERYIKEHGLYR